MKHIIAVMAGLIFLASTGLVMAEETETISQKPLKPIHKIQKKSKKSLNIKLKNQGKVAGNSFRKGKLNTRPLPHGGKLGVNENGSQKVELNPQPEPPKPQTSLGNGSQSVQLNPQPEPPKPALGGAANGLGTKR